MDDEKLIECVRKYEFLYNLKHPKYMDNVRKDIAWNEIASQLKKSAGGCKQRWQVLRDACRRAINKRKGKSGQVKTFKKWKYEDEMSFVVPFFVERKPHDSMEITSDGEGSDIDNELFCNASNTTNTNVGVYKTVDVNVDTNYQGIAEDVEKHNTNQIKNQYNQTKKINAKNGLVKKAKYRPVQSPSAILIAKLLEKQNKMESQREHDELDRFFLNISETVKKFSPYQQALAKNKIFAIISEMELQQLAPSSPNDFTPSPQSSPRDSVVLGVIPKLELP